MEINFFRRSRLLRFNDSNPCWVEKEETVWNNKVGNGADVCCILMLVSCHVHANRALSARHLTAINCNNAAVGNNDAVKCAGECRIPTSGSRPPSFSCVTFDIHQPASKRTRKTRKELLHFHFRSASDFSRGWLQAGRQQLRDTHEVWLRIRGCCSDVGLFNDI